MKILLLITLILLTSNSYADYVTCYSKNKIIYQHEVRNVYYDDEGLFIIDEGKNKELILYNADCLVRQKGAN